MEMSFTWASKMVGYDVGWMGGWMPTHVSTQPPACAGWQGSSVLAAGRLEAQRRAHALAGSHWCRRRRRTVTATLAPLPPLCCSTYLPQEVKLLVTLLRQHHSGRGLRSLLVPASRVKASWPLSPPCMAVSCHQACQNGSRSFNRCPVHPHSKLLHRGGRPLLRRWVCPTWRRGAPCASPSSRSWMSFQWRAVSRRVVPQGGGVGGGTNQASCGVPGHAMPVPCRLGACCSSRRSSVLALRHAALWISYLAPWFCLQVSFMGAPEFRYDIRRAPAALPACRPCCLACLLPAAAMHRLPARGPHAHASIHPSIFHAAPWGETRTWCRELSRQSRLSSGTTCCGKWRMG